MGALVLESDRLTVTVLPEKGCDIYALVDKATSVDLLFKSPWGLRPSAGARPHATASQVAWLEQYGGGWQVLLPNGGAACEERGVEWGFHGEACVVPWTVDEVTKTAAQLHVDLTRAPLRVERQLSVEGPTLRVEETVSNRSPHPIEAMWSHHPAFGAPFLEAGCRIDIPAIRLEADDETPGTMLLPGSVHEWPVATATDGQPVDLSLVPGPDDPRWHFGYLTGLREGCFAVTNPRRRLGVRFTWPLDVFPAAWFWQEVHASADYPWFGRAYVTAIEPCTTFPGQGIAAARRKGGQPLGLGGLESRTVVVTATVFTTEEERSPTGGAPDNTASCLGRRSRPR